MLANKTFINFIIKIMPKKKSQVKVVSFFNNRYFFIYVRRNNNYTK